MSEVRNLINITDFTIEEIDELIDVANDIVADHAAYEEICKHKKLATLFFEPSTRTRLSFEAAMLEMGGSVLGFSEASSSSAAKGESVSDTIQTVCCYADIIAMRHPKEGAPIVGARRTTVPIINAGDGGHFHPTQTLTDLLTIKRKKGRLDNMTVGLCGDLKFGRTVHSLIEAMIRYENIKFVLISPQELQVPKYVKEELNKHGVEWKEVESLEEAMPELDILYMTRIQRERFFNEEDYVRLKDSYILDLAKLENAKEDLTIMHPLPRVNEISVEVDDDPRACYFFQALCGKHIRMALILKLLGIKKGEQEGMQIMNIDGVKTGIVLDHIKAGKSMEIYKYLKLDKIDNTVAIIKNASSEKYGKKDIIKIDELIELDLDVLGYIDSNITVNIVKDGKLFEKKHLELPETLDNVIKCKNPRCITSIEQEIVHTFKLVDREKKVYRCAYCDAEYKEKK